MKIKNGILMIAFILPLGVFGQIQSGLSESSESLSQADKGFEDYCLKESISYIEVVASKSSGIIFSGEMTSMELNSNATHLDYGVELKEEKTQYFVPTKIKFFKNPSHLSTLHFSIFIL